MAVAVLHAPMVEGTTHLRGIIGGNLGILQCLGQGYLIPDLILPRAERFLFFFVEILTDGNKASLTTTPYIALSRV